MPIDWGYVKKTTLWHYEPLIAKLQAVLDYAFVQDHYLHTMDEAASFAVLLHRGYIQDGQQADFVLEISDHFGTLARLGVDDYLDLVQKVESKAKCEHFVQATGFGFEALIQTLNYLLRWALPFKCRLKELVDPNNEDEMGASEVLQGHKIKSNLDLLEAGRTRAGRRRLSQEAGISLGILLKLVHRADMTRLAYVRGKTVLHLCGGGYDSMEKLAAADSRQIEADMSAYYKTLGKTFSDFKAVIPLDWMVGGAGVLPRVVEG